MINLGFYRLLQEEKGGRIIEEPDSDCRYTPYEMFVIETRLFPLIYDLLGDINIFVQSMLNKEKNRMDVYLKFAKFQSLEEQGEEKEELIPLSKEIEEKIKKRLYEIQSENISYALINVKELYRSNKVIYPFDWFRSVLEYAMPDKFDEYNPFIRSEGIYLTFNPNSEYKLKYLEICQEILKKIDEFYEKGVIVLEETFENEKWGLKSSSDKRLYAVTWEDKRFANNIVDFLLERIQGEKFISFDISNNLVKRHGTIFMLQGEGYNPFIETSRLKVECNNYEDAKKIADLIDRGFATTYGRVSIFPVARMSEVYLYSEYSYKNEIGDYVAYFADGSILFSILLKNENTDTDALGKSLKDYAVKRLIEVSKISKLKHLSPHDAIEQEYSK